MAKKTQESLINRLAAVSGTASTYFSAIAITLILGAIVVGIGYGTRTLQNRAALVLDHGNVTISIDWPQASGGGTWMPQASREELIDLAREAAGPSSDILEPRQLKYIATAMEQSGWFASSPLVTRESGGRISIRGQWRIPAANVRYRDQAFLISWDGCPMPPGVEAPKWILDPASGPPRDATGERNFTYPWSGEDIAASLELLDRVVREPWANQVKGIDASQYVSQGQLALITDNETRVVWGGRPKKPALGEVSTPQKLEHIRQLVKDTRRIDANYPLIYVNQERLQFDISATAVAKRSDADDQEEPTVTKSSRR